MSSELKQLSYGSAAHITDGEVVFQVPVQYVTAILKAVPELRHSFEDLGGVHRGATSVRAIAT